MDVKGKVVTVMGLGKSGYSAARLLCEKGVKVKISEKGERREIKDEFLKDLEIEWGGHTEGFVLQSDLIVKSPGIPGDIEVLIKARRIGIPIISEIELAYSYVTGQRIIAITGTNGKSTVTRLIGEILKMGGKQVKVGGNIGFPFSEIILEGLKSQDLIVLEVSSFQLEDIIDFKPYISVFLNLTEDHLDRYRNMEEYKCAKLRIFENQASEDFAVLNVDDPALSDIDILPKVIPFSKHLLKEGVFVKDGKIFLNDKIVCEISDLKIQGEHNLENVLASIGVVGILDIDFGVMKEAISSFQGLEHRLEFVLELQGIRFINDSKSTNIDSLRKALDCTPSPIVLIAGGKNKGFDYTQLKDLIKRKVRRLVLFGEVKEEVASSLKGTTIIYTVSDIRDAVSLAYKEAKKGDTILFSPGTSSLDQFRDFEERGKVFKELVAKIQDGEIND